MAKNSTWILGVVLTLVGIWGYLAGGAPVFGIFAVDGVHNFVHLATGILGILAALGGEKYMKTYLQVFGVIYVIVFLLGVFTSGKVLGLFTSNGADDVLHLVVAVVALYGGFGKAQGATMPAMSPPSAI